MDGPGFEELKNEMEGGEKWERSGDRGGRGGVEIDNRIILCFVWGRVSKQ